MLILLESRDVLFFGGSKRVFLMMCIQSRVRVYLSNSAICVIYDALYNIVKHTVVRFTTSAWDHSIMFVALSHLLIRASFCPSSSCSINDYTKHSKGKLERHDRPRKGCTLGFTLGCTLRIFPEGASWGSFRRVFPGGLSWGSFLRLLPLWSTLRKDP